MKTKKKTKMVSGIDWGYFSKPLMKSIMDDLTNLEEHIYQRSKMISREVEDDEDEVDPIVDRVCQRLIERSLAGQRKYGCKMTRLDIDFLGWLNHLQEELLDAAVYVERLKDEQMVSLNTTKS
jgi:uncharacterized protein Yka (UPF0111/DUF47 family)